MSRLLKIFIAFCLTLTLTACEKQKSENVIRVGTIAGPETELVLVAKKVAQEKYHLDVQVVEFTDYALPNAALNDGSLDANIFQHQPYLEAAIKAHHYHLVAIGKTFIYPVGIYSKTIKNLSELKSGAVVLVPNDPSNEARALLLLEKAKLIQLKPNAGANATVLDISNNPLHLKIKELDAAQLPRVLDDASIAVINTNYAVPAGLLPSRDALFLENKDSPYANLIVVRTADQNNPQLKELVEAMHSKPVIHKAEELFHGQAIAAW